MSELSRDNLGWPLAKATQWWNERLEAGFREAGFPEVRPSFGSVVVPSKHEARYASGFHRAGRVLMYVSRGIGAIPPLRILCKPEIATFVLRRDDSNTLGSLA